MGTLRNRPTISPGKSTIDAHFVWITLRKWWVFCLLMGLPIAGAACVALFYTHVPVYEAQARFLIKPATDPILFESPFGDSERFVANQIELLRSQTVLAPVTSDPRVVEMPELVGKADPVREIAKRIRVTPVGKSDFYDVLYTGYDPAGCAHLVNLVVDQYTREYHSDQDHRSDQLVQFLNAERERRENEVKYLKEQVKKYTEQATGQQIVVSQSADEIERELAVSPELSKLQQMRTEVDFRLSVLMAQQAYDEQWSEKNPVRLDEEIISAQLESHPQIVELQQRHADKSLLLESAKKAAADGFEQTPEYRRRVEDVRKAEKQLADARAELLPMIRNALEQQGAAMRADALATSREEIEKLTIEKQVLDDRYQKELKSMRQINSDVLLMLEFTRSELERAEEVVDMINERLMKIRIERNARPQVLCLERAEAPVAPIEAPLLKKLGLAAAMGMMLPFGLAVLWELKVKRVNHREQLELSSQLPVVGEIASLPTRRRAATHADELWLFEESVDSLRTSLVLSDQAEALRVISVTSAASQEGKTSVASQLAVSIARSTGQPTLLVDGDMRSPDIHNVFDLENSVGLAELLAGDAGLDEALQATWSPELTVMPAGHLKSSPHRLVGSDRWNGLLGQLRQRFRYIVVDTPPLLAASESLVMAKATDAVLICAMRDFSRMDQVTLAYNRLMDASAPAVGVVLNGVPGRRYAYAYGKYGYARR